MNRITRSLAIALEAVGCCVIAAGIAIEVSLHADIGYIAITAGSLGIAVGGLLFSKLLKRRKE